MIEKEQTSGIFGNGPNFIKVELGLADGGGMLTSFPPHNEPVCWRGPRWWRIARALNSNAGTSMAIAPADPSGATLKPGGATRPCLAQVWMGREPRGIHRLMHVARRAGSAEKVSDPASRCRLRVSVRRRRKQSEDTVARSRVRLGTRFRWGLASFRPTPEGVASHSDVMSRPEVPPVRCAGADPLALSTLVRSRREELDD